MPQMFQGYRVGKGYCCATVAAWPGELLARRGRNRAQPPLRPQLCRVVDKRMEAPSRDAAQLDRRDGLRRIRILIHARQAEDVTGKSKTGDRPAAIRQNPIPAEAAFRHLDEIRRRIGFAEHRFSGLQLLDRLTHEDLAQIGGLGDQWVSRRSAAGRGEEVG